MILRIRPLRLLTALFAVAVCASCINRKQVLYLQDMENGSQIQLEDKFEARISSYDQLYIYVSCYDEELSKPFNIMNNSTTNTYSEGTRGYLVDVNGNIQFPILGEIHAAGLTRLKLQEKIRNMLIDGGYIQDPYVNVRFLSFKVFFLGANGGKVISVNNERCTFLEALAMSGDMSIYTRRDKIAVMREVDGKMTVRYLDPRSSEVFNDPYFLLQQNDFIITQNIGSKYTKDNIDYWLSFLTIVTSLASVATLILAILKM